MIKTGIMSTAYFGISDYEQGIKKLKSHGYDCVDYRAIESPFSELFSYSETQFDSYFKALGQCAREEGVEIVQIHGLWPRYADGDLSGVDKDMEFYLKEMRAMECMGSKRFVLHPCLPYGWGEEAIKEKAFEETVKTVGRLLPYAKQSGIMICVENLPVKKGHSFSSIQELKKLIRTINDGNVKACFDTGHNYCTGEDVYESIMLLGEDLEALHVHDAMCGQDRHLIPFHGEIEWDKFIKGLNDIRYQGCLSLETEISLKMPEEIREKMQKALAELARWFASQIK